MIHDEPGKKWDIQPGEDPELDAKMGEGYQRRVHEQSKLNHLQYLKDLLSILDPNEDYSHITLAEQGILSRRLDQFSLAQIAAAKEQIIKPREEAPDPTPEQEAAANQASADSMREYLKNKLNERIKEIKPEFQYTNQSNDELKALYAQLKGNQ